MLEIKILGKAARIYAATGSIRAVAKELEISEYKARKILATINLLDTEAYKQITDMLKVGLTPQEVAAERKVTVNCVNSYLPYSKSIYGSPEPTKNAAKIRRCRKRKSML